MLELSPNDLLTGRSRLQGSHADLALHEVEVKSLWSVQGNRDTTLAEFINVLFNVEPSIASPSEVILNNAGLQLLKLWPHQAYLLTEQDTLPDEASIFTTLMTDISHGMCRFHLGGEHAFAFLSSYTSADLAPHTSKIGCRRCLLGQYPIILRWQDPDEIHLLVDRSYTQSFYDYISQLMSRWSATTA
jgi:sarcosine oxidase gamma subunit